MLNRRNFIVSITGFLATIPFLSGLFATKKPSIRGNSENFTVVDDIGRVWYVPETDLSGEVIYSKLPDDIGRIEWYPTQGMKFESYTYLPEA